MFFAQQHAGKILLAGPDSSAEIWPSCGAILQSWKHSFNGVVHEFIEGYDSMADFSRKCESKGFRSCKLSPFVCRLAGGSYEFEGVRYELGKHYLGGSSIHGLLYDVPFDVVSVTAEEQHAMAVLRYHYAGALDGYPFPFEVTVTYLLGAGGKLHLGTTVINRHKKAIPLSDGWHPYFTLGTAVDNCKLQIATETMLEFDKALLPTGALVADKRFTEGALLGDTSLDNCFLLRKPLLGEPACTLSDPASGLQLTISPDESYPYLQVYIPPHRKSIAIENLSSAPDAFNNKMGLLILEPNETMSFHTTYTASKTA